MPKNTKGGNKAKRGSNKHTNGPNKLILKSDGDDGGQQFYGVVTKVSGGGRFIIKTEERIEIIGCQRGRRQRVGMDSVVIVANRPWATRRDDKLEQMDIVMVYNTDDARTLKRLNYFDPEQVLRSIAQVNDNQAITDDDIQDSFDFLDI
uniref:S1-like domain-containing protein n=1 Tax=Megaviridae environmental sample TaxID=1737588 RepID=A0A5J6VIH1_9VIRU|nr:MAG: hypothetical protein [Megaviridae environmental sample]